MEAEAVSAALAVVTGPIAKPILKARALKTSAVFFICVSLKSRSKGITGLGA
ncbi:hypothetical protein D3C80_2203040 [compost metagenome]